MCKLLFFDTESGNSHTGSMCSFGYILTDESFNIIEQEDIFMNPNIKWEKRVLNEVLFYPKECYEGSPEFNYHYDRIKALFSNDTLVFGHAINNDVIALNQACKRYNLPFIDFKYFISDRIYKEFTGDKNKNEISLDKISKQMGLERQGEKHTSLQDAKLVMLQVKKMCEILEMSIIDIINVVDYCDGENIGGKLSSKRIPVSYDIKHNLIKGHNNEKFTWLLNTITVTHSKKSKYNNKRLSIASSYEYFNYKEMLLIVRLLAKMGGYYIRKASLSDYYVVFDSKIEDNKIQYVDDAIKNGRKITKIKLEDFLVEIGFRNEDVDRNYKELVDLWHKPKRRENQSGSSFGEIVGDKLNKYFEKGD